MTGKKVAKKNKMKKKKQDQVFLSEGVVQAKHVKSKKQKPAKVFKVQYNDVSTQPDKLIMQETSSLMADKSATRVTEGQLKKLGHLCDLLREKFDQLGQQSGDLGECVQKYKKNQDNANQEHGPKIAKLPTKEPEEEPSFLNTIEGILEFITRPEVGNMVSEVVNGFAKG